MSLAHLDMYHLVFGINFQIHSVSLTVLVSIHLLIHFSTHLCHMHNSKVRNYKTKLILSHYTNIFNV